MSKNRKTLLLIIAFSLLIRLLAFFELKDTPIIRHPIADAESYVSIASHILSGDLYGTTTFTNPFYYYFTTLIEFIFGFFASPKFFALLIVQALLSSFTIVIMFKLAEDVFGYRVAVVSAVLLALDGVLVFFDNTVLSVSLINSLNALMLYFLFMYHKKQKIIHLFLSGIFCGLSIITRANLYLFVPFVILWLWIAVDKNIKGRFKPALKNSAVFIAGVLVFVIAIMIRNYVVTGEVIPVSSNFGYNFYVGNNEKANGTYVKPDFIHSTYQYYEEKQSEEEADRRTGKTLSHSGASWYWFGEGMKFIEQYPIKFISLLGRKTYLFFNRIEAANNLSNYTAEDYSILLRLLPANFGVLSALALLGFVFGIQNKREARLYLLLFYVLTYFLANLIIMTASEYRAPVIMIFVMFAVYGVFRLYEYYKRRKYGVLSALVIPVLLFVYWTNYHNSSLDNYRSTEADYDAYANGYLQAKNYEGAINMYTRAVESDTTKKYLYFKIAKLYHLENDNASALKYYRLTPNLDRYPDSTKLDYIVLVANELFADKDYLNASVLLQKVTSIDTSDFSSLSNLGVCYMQMDSLDKAERYLLKAFAVNPGYFYTNANLGRIYFVKGLPEKSLYYMENAHNIDSANPNVKLDLIRLYLMTKNKSKADELVSELQNSYPDNSPVIIQMKKIVAQMK